MHIYIYTHRHVSLHNRCHTHVYMRMSACVHRHVQSHLCTCTPIHYSSKLHMERSCQVYVDISLNEYIRIQIHRCTYASAHAHVYIHPYEYIHDPHGLQEHRIRASPLRLGPEQRGLRFVNDMLLEDVYADVAGHVQSTPNTVKAYVLLHEPQLWLSFCSMDLREQNERQGCAASKQHIC